MAAKFGGDLNAILEDVQRQEASGRAIWRRNRKSLSHRQAWRKFR